MTSFQSTNLVSPTLPILLRNPSLKDATTFSAILSNPLNNKHDLYAQPLSPSSAESTISDMVLSASAAIPTRVNLVIVLLSYPGASETLDSPVIGLSGVGGIDVIDGRRWADVGVMVNPEHRGKGFALESLRLSIEFAFRELSVHGVSCQMDSANVEMVGLVEGKLGWSGVKGELEGVGLRFEILPFDWEATKKRMGWE